MAILIVWLEIPIALHGIPSQGVATNQIGSLHGPCIVWVTYLQLLGEMAMCSLLLNITPPNGPRKKGNQEGGNPNKRFS